MSQSETRLRDKYDAAMERIRTLEDSLSHALTAGSKLYLELDAMCDHADLMPDDAAEAMNEWDELYERYAVPSPQEGKEIIAFDSNKGGFMASLSKTVSAK